MRVAVITCKAYSDAWRPFFELFHRFWSDCPYPLWLLTNEMDSHADVPVEQNRIFAWNIQWAKLLGAFAESDSSPVLMMQEDFFLNAPVERHMVRYALEQLQKRQAGSCRIYPCPGPDEDYGDPYLGRVQPGARYRTSCQATIWRADYLADLCARPEIFDPWTFEIYGSQYSSGRSDEVLAFKREREPWPIQYLCSAINRGQWNPHAKELCEKYGINVDWSRRRFQAVAKS